MGDKLKNGLTNPGGPYGTCNPFSRNNGDVKMRCRYHVRICELCAGIAGGVGGGRAVYLCYLLSSLISHKSPAIRISSSVPLDHPAPPRRHRIDSPVCPGECPAAGTHGIRIPAEIDGREHGVLKCTGIHKTGECRMRTEHRVKRGLGPVPLVTSELIQHFCISAPRAGVDKCLPA